MMLILNIFSILKLYFKSEEGFSIFGFLYGERDDHEFDESRVNEYDWYVVAEFIEFSTNYDIQVLDLERFKKFDNRYKLFIIKNNF